MQHPTEAQIDRLGLRAAARLNIGTDKLPHHVTERLRAAREQALGHRKLAAVVAAPSVLHAGTAAVLQGPGGGDKGSRWRHALGMALPVLVLVIGLATIERFQKQRLADELATMDTAVLVDELPPAAYADPGFAQFIKASLESDDQ